MHSLKFHEHMCDPADTTADCRNGRREHPGFSKMKLFTLFLNKANYSAFTDEI